jgi:ATP-dependent Lon protease
MHYRQGWIVGVDEECGYLVPYELVAKESGAGQVSFSGPVSDEMRADFTLALRSVELNLSTALQSIKSFDWHFHLFGNRLELSGPSHRMSLAVNVLSIHIPAIAVRTDEAVMTGDVLLCGKFVPVDFIEKKAAAARRHGFDNFYVAADQEAPSTLRVNRIKSLNELVSGALSRPTRQSFIPSELRP